MAADREVVFIDGRVENLPALVAGMRPGVAAMVLPEAESAPAAMARLLGQRANLDAIHIIAHGAPGAIGFAAGTLSVATIAGATDELRRLGAALADDGEILLWTCRTAEGEDGADFIDALAEATGANVAGASGLIGGAAKGGRWELDTITAAGAPLTQQARQTYEGIMTIDVFSVDGVSGGDTFINSDDLDSGDVVVNVSRTSNTPTDWGDAALVLVKDGSGTLVYWEIIALSNSTSTFEATIPVGSLPQGPLQFLVFQGDGTATSGTTTYPTVGQFDLHGPAAGTTVSAGTASDFTQINATLDTVAPTVPTITSITDNVEPITGLLTDGGSTNDTTLVVRVSITGTGAVAGDEVELRNGNNSLGNSVTLSAGDITNGFIDITTPVLTNGNSYNIRARITDANDNDSPTSTDNAWNITVDTTAPAGTPVITLVNDNVGATTGDVANGGNTDDNTLGISGTGTGGNTVAIFDGATLLGTATVTGGGTWSLTTPALSLGGHSFTARYVDTAGNLGTATAARTVTVQPADGIPPTVVSIVLSDTALKIGDTATVTITFSEAVTAFSNADVTVPNGTLSALSSNNGGITWTGTYTPNALVEDATNVIGVTAGGYTDAAGNAGGAGSSANFTIDTAAPIVFIDVDSGTVNAEDAAGDIALTGNVSGEFEEGDIVTLTVNGTEYTGPVAANGDFSILVPGSELVADPDSTIDASFTTTDAAGNVGSVVTTQGYVVDLDAAITINPTATDDIINALEAGSNVTVSGTTTGVEDGRTVNVTLEGQLLDSTVVTGGTWSFDVSPATLVLIGNGEFTLQAFVSDVAGNDATVLRDLAIDTVAPTVTVDIVDAALNDVDTASVVTMVFSEVPTGFTAGDLTPVGGAISGFTQDLVTDPTGRTYTATFTADDAFDGEGSVTVGTGWSDAAGNPGVGDADTVDIDRVSPTVAVDIVDATLFDGNTSSVVTFVFSEVPTGFTDADLTVVGGVVTGLAQDLIGDPTGLTYTATFTANNAFDGTGSVTVGADWTDATGNAGTGAADTVDIDTVTDLINDPPSGVGFLNIVVATAENGGSVKVADLTIADDANVGNNNILSLSGADAGSFSIQNGDELWFDGGADFETKTNYAVTVEVNDPAVGTTTPDGASLFNLAITDLGGANIAGTNAKDKIDATHGPAGPQGQPQVATTEADTINGKGGNDKIAGLAGNDTLKGGSGKDKLNGGDDDDLLIGGGDADTFFFGVGDGNDTVKGAKPEDKFKLGDTDVDTFAELKALMTDLNGNVVIDFGGGDSLTILNATIQELSQNKSHFDFG